MSILLLGTFLYSGNKKNKIYKVAVLMKLTLSVYTHTHAHTHSYMKQ